MEDPISTFKVDFGFSKGCPPDVRDMLKQLKGVKSILIDPHKGEVKVVGNVNPRTVIKFFEKIATKAKICSFDKEAKKRHSSHSNNKHHSHYCCESSDSEDEFEACHSTRHGQSSKKWYDHSPPMNGYYDGPPMFGYHYQQQPFPGYHHYPPHPRMYPGPPPPPPPPPPMYPGPRPMYGYYGM